MGFHFGAPFPSDQRTVPDRCDPIFRGGYSFVLVRFCFSALAPTRRRVPRRRCQIDGKFRPLRRPTQVHRSSAIGRPWDDDRKKTGSKRFIFLFFFGKKKKNPPSTRDSMKETPEPTHLYRETHWGGHEKRRKRKNRYVPGRSKNTSFFFVRKRGKRNNPEPEPNDDEEEFQKRKKKETAATDLQRPIDAPGRLFSVPKRGRSFLFFLYFFFWNIAGTQ